MDRDTDNRDQAGTDRPAGETDNQPLDESLGAYLLDALPEAERREFEAHLAASPDLRAEAALLAPVVRALPGALEQDVSDAAPPAALRERILSAALADTPAPVPATEMPSQDSSHSDQGAPIPLRPRGRIRPATGGAPMPPSAGWWIPSALVAAVMALVAIGAVAWALNLQGQVDEREEDLIALQNQATSAALRENAVAWTFTPTEDGPQGATGNLFYSRREQRVALACEGLPQLPKDQVYQLWYLNEGQDPQPAGTFKASPDGKAAMIEHNIVTGSFQQVAITAEPEGGSQAPTSPVLLLGTISAAG